MSNAYQTSRGGFEYNCKLRGYTTVTFTPYHPLQTQYSHVASTYLITGGNPSLKSENTLT